MCCQFRHIFAFSAYRALFLLHQMAMQNYMGQWATSTAPILPPPGRWSGAAPCVPPPEYPAPDCFPRRPEPLVDAFLQTRNPAEVLSRGFDPGMLRLPNLSPSPCRISLRISSTSCSSTSLATCNRLLSSFLQVLPQMRKVSLRAKGHPCICASQTFGASVV